MRTPRGQIFIYVALLLSTVLWVITDLHALKSALIRILFYSVFIFTVFVLPWQVIGESGCEKGEQLTFRVKKYLYAFLITNSQLIVGFLLFYYLWGLLQDFLFYVSD